MWHPSWINSTSATPKVPNVLFTKLILITALTYCCRMRWCHGCSDLGAARQDVLQQALRRACRQGRPQTVSLLLSRGADVEGINDVSGRTSLHEAAIAANVPIMQMVC